MHGGNNHFVALKANGEVWTWGYNGYGNLGLYNNDNQTKPSKTDIYDASDETQEVYAIDVAAGYQHTLVLKSDGTVWATGYNGYGQLGIGDTANTNSFVQVKGPNGEGYLTDVVEIAANNSSSYALKSDGTVYSWGYNHYGQFGIGYGTGGNANPYPVKMQKIANAIQITAGENHVSILDADGSVWSLGYNGYGQFGLNNTTGYVLPQKMLNESGTEVLKGIKKIAAGLHHTLLLKEDGTVLSCGINNYGQLGLRRYRQQIFTTSDVRKFSKTRRRRKYHRRSKESNQCKRYSS